MVLAVVAVVWVFTGRHSANSRAALEPAATPSTTVAATSTASSSTAPTTTGYPATSAAPADTSGGTSTTAVTPTGGGGSLGGQNLGLPSSNTYPYHSTGVDWPGLNTTDPRCLPILRNQRVLELANFHGMTLQQAVAALQPIGMYSYCTNGTIINTQFIRDPDACTDNPALADRVASQSPAPGTRVTPGIFQVHLSYYNPGLPCPTTTTTATPTTTAPPGATSTLPPIP